MEHRAVYTAAFIKALNDLVRRGAVGKRVRTKAQAAAAEFSTTGEISLPLTDHGESRLPHVKKYDLGENNYRLVVQSVPGARNVRAFLFVGPHEETQRWLDSHRDYVWVARALDKTLEFVQATTHEPRPTTVIASSPSDGLIAPSGPVLGVVSAAIRQLPFATSMLDYLLTVTHSDIARDEFGILDQLCRLESESAAFAAHDLLHHGYHQQWRELHARIENLLERAAILEGDSLAEAMLDDANAERFVTFDDLRELPQPSQWDKWLLFLSPKQKEFARKSLEGPARLRGVSGSGKTCVLLHRARHLVNRYDANAMVVTSTESMRALLDRLLDKLCEGMVRNRIATRTVVGLARDVIREVTGCPESMLSMAGAEDHEAMMRAIGQEVVTYPGFGRSGLGQFDERGLQSFLSDELNYVRSRLRSKDYELYLDPQRFPRRGRGRRLTVEGRGICIRAARAWEQQLDERGKWDAFSLVQFALALIEGDEKGWTLPAQSSSAFGVIPRERATIAQLVRHNCAILVDEVQDLSQLEISLLAGMPADGQRAVSQAADGLYLVGDSAQAIYKKGFSLRACGIELPGARSFSIKKNYRNTREVLEAAFEVIKDFKYADFGDDGLAIPTSPEFAMEYGPKPTIVACASLHEEAQFVAEQIRELRQTGSWETPGAGDDEPPDMVIGIIAASHWAREAIIEELRRREMSFGELRVDQPDAWNATMVCDIESCKGHEFQAVFVVGVQDDSIPRSGVDEDDLPREAARLYVAMTRARRQLFITHSTGDGAAPSPFLWLARSRCQEGRSRNGRFEPGEEEYRSEYAEADRRRWDGWLSQLREQLEGSRDEPQQEPSPDPPPQPIVVDDTVASDSSRDRQTLDDEPPPRVSPSGGGIPASLGGKALGKHEILVLVARGDITTDEANALLNSLAHNDRGGLYCKVSEKGAVSVYGLQRMPVTLYADQWERLLEFGQEIKRFGEVNQSSLKRKVR